MTPVIAAATVTGAVGAWCAVLILLDRIARWCGFLEDDE